MAVDPLDDAWGELRRAGVDPAVSARLIGALRARWGGAEHYIKQAGAEREDAIRQGLEAGRPPVELAKAVGVHPATIRRRRSSWLG